MHASAPPPSPSAIRKLPFSRYAVMSSTSVRSRSRKRRSTTNAALISDTSSGTSVMVAVRIVLVIFFQRRWGPTPTRFALRRSRARLRGDLVAILRRRRRRQRIDQATSDVGHLVDGTIERGLVRLRWRVESAQLADELQRRRADFFLSRRRIEIEKRFDVSAHLSFL